MDVRTFIAGVDRVELKEGFGLLAAVELRLKDGTTALIPTQFGGYSVESFYMAAEFARLAGLPAFYDSINKGGRTLEQSYPSSEALRSQVMANLESHVAEHFANR